VLGLRPGDIYPSRDRAAQDALADICSMCRTADREYGGWIYQRSDGTFSYTPPTRGLEHAVKITTFIPIPPGTKQVGAYHCHGDWSWDYDDAEFGKGDKQIAAHLGTPAYLATPAGDIKRFTPYPWQPGQTPEGSETPLGKCECQKWDQNFFRRNGRQLY